MGIKISCGFMLCKGLVKQNLSSFIESAFKLVYSSSDCKDSWEKIGGDFLLFRTPLWAVQWAK